MPKALWLAVMLLAAPSAALACSCSFVGTEPSFDAAKAVFVGEIVSAQYKFVPSGFPPRKDELPENHVESAKVIVKTAWKGVEVGQSIVFQSEFQGRRGMCGDSFWGRSALRHMLDKGQQGLPFKKAKTWLIFMSDEEPHSFSLCDMVEPAESEWAQKVIKVLDARALQK